MEEEHLRYYVINFFTGGYGIINLDYINEIPEIHNVYATPFKYLYGLNIVLLKLSLLKILSLAIKSSGLL